MCVKLKNITYMDKYIYCMALSLEQPFTATELLKAIHIKYSSWNIKFIKTKCKKFKKQKMIRQIGYFRNTKYQCLLNIEDLKNATYIYIKSDKSLSTFVCGL